MPKATKAPAKKKSTAKVGGGGVGTRVSKLNLKIVIPIVVLVAALGGFYIFRKSSASWVLFRSADQINGPQVKKQNGQNTVHVVTNGSVSTWVTNYEIMSGSVKRICATVPVVSKDDKWYIKIQVLAEGAYYFGETDWINSTKLCTRRGSDFETFKQRLGNRNGAEIRIQSNSYKAQAWVANIYGEL